MKYLITALVLVVTQFQVAMAEDKAAKKETPPAKEQPAAVKADTKGVKEAPVPAPTEPKPLEDVLAVEKDPNGKNIMVTTHILVVDPNAQKGQSLKIRFIDVKPTPSVYVKKWDAKLSDIKPGSTLSVTGTLHFGTCRGGTRSLRYKVKEVGGRKYNDHRHWRTDKAIYITDPTYGVQEPAPGAEMPKDDPADEKPKDGAKSEE